MLWQRYLQNWWKCTTETPQGVSFRICLRHCRNVLMGQHGLVTVRYSCNVLVQHCCDVPLRRLGKVPPRRSWVFQLWLVCREHLQTVCRCYVLFRRCQHAPSWKEGNMQLRTSLEYSNEKLFDVSFETYQQHRCDKQKNIVTTSSRHLLVWWEIID